MFKEKFGNLKNSLIKSEKKDGKYTFSPIFDNNCSFGLEHFDMNKRCTDYFIFIYYFIHIFKII